MSTCASESLVLSGHVSHLATPTRHRSPFTTADAELSAITAECTDCERLFIGRSSRGGNIAANNTPVQMKETAVSPQRRRDTVSPTMTCRASGAGQVTMSPRCRRRAGVSLMDVDALGGLPRIQLAVPPSGRRHGPERSQLSETSGSLVLRESGAEGHSGRMSLQRGDARCAGEPKTTTLLLSITPTEHHEESAGSKSPFLCTASASMAAVEASGANHKVRSPSSPCFSFFSTVEERRHSRKTAAVDSARGFVRESRLAVSPRSFALPSQPSPLNDAAAASVSSSALPTEVKVFSPLRFDARTAPSVQSQGLSSVAPSQHSSFQLLPPYIAVSQWHSETEEDYGNDRNVVSTDECGAQEEVRDVIKQQRLLHACVLSLVRERDELAMEVQRLRQRRAMAMLRRVFHLLLRLPFRILAQAFQVFSKNVKEVVSTPVSAHR